MATLFIVVFLVILGLVWLSLSLGLKLWEAQTKKRVSGMLESVKLGTEYAAEAKVIVRNVARESAIAAALARWNLAHKLEARIKQAGLTWSVERFLVSTLVLAILGALLGTQLKVLMFTLASAIALGCLFGFLPYFYVSRKRSGRMRQFEKQFPEALDFLARAMRAGHAFSASLDMLATESPEPLGPEFRRLYDEQNLGSPIDVALRNLVTRMPLVDVRFFVSAVLLQKETGGNLAEILRNLARVIRERFQVKGQVRAASAHGRMTAIVLTILPIVTMLLLMLVAPGYLQSMAQDPRGRYLIAGAIVGLFTGYYFMRRITNIKI